MYYSWATKTTVVNSRMTHYSDAGLITCSLVASYVEEHCSPSFFICHFTLGTKKSGMENGPVPVLMPELPRWDHHQSSFIIHIQKATQTADQQTIWDYRSTWELTDVGENIRALFRDSVCVLWIRKELPHLTHTNRFSYAPQYRHGA